jgi:hypothetical protein
VGIIRWINPKVFLLSEEGKDDEKDNYGDFDEFGCYGYYGFSLFRSRCDLWMLPKKQGSFKNC